jgi:hypothetical protein
MSNEMKRYRSPAFVIANSLLAGEATRQVSAQTGRRLVCEIVALKSILRKSHGRAKADRPAKTLEAGSSKKIKSLSRELSSRKAAF